ncbi:ERI1 exoribonuclease 2 isoform X6 [Tursiops truncatus]|uniref:ERI1 exoribonuclease 2 isoform X5 n=1 Tax=Pseudorca crassidens TaxID=82174 RepID=UPI00352ECB4C
MDRKRKYSDFRQLGCEEKGASGMATKRLARQLGLIRRKSIAPPNGNLGRSKSKQLFDYLIVIDFESTCWNDGKRHRSQEIIEFPAILLNTSTGEIESEFHAYVHPQEHPILSEFCMELTGIKQAQVDEGVPLKICLSQFCKWIQKIQQQKKITFATRVSDISTSEVKLCAFVTWSDWDLGVCLEYECKRKQLLKPVFLNSWIDLRVTYKIFYRRKPKGLSGALQEVGIEFLGREHFGLDDSRNTALLAWKMIRDGCLMKITRSLNKVPTKRNPNIFTRNLNMDQVEEISACNSSIHDPSIYGGAKRNPSSPLPFPPAKKQTFTIHEEKPTSSNGSPGGSSSRKVLPSILTSTVNVQDPWKGGKITPPLCKCGRRSKRLVASNNGPNHGKVFYCCPIGKYQEKRKCCGYFKWEQTLQKETANSIVLSHSPGGHTFNSPETSHICDRNVDFSTKNSLRLRPSMRN